MEIELLDRLVLDSGLIHHFILLVPMLIIISVQEKFRHLNSEIIQLTVVEFMECGSSNNIIQERIISKVTVTPLMDWLEQIIQWKHLLHGVIVEELNSLMDLVFT